TLEDAYSFRSILVLSHILDKGSISASLCLFYLNYIYIGKFLHKKQSTYLINKAHSLPTSAFPIWYFLMALYETLRPSTRLQKINSLYIRSSRSLQPYK